ncbi:MAG: transposase [Planctomycetota bacterium]|nr:transposase [Planctomycetota bacterium]
MKQAKQANFVFRSWGGVRNGAGRKPSGERKKVAHAKRPAVAARHPVHVTLRLERGLESLRKRRTFHLVRTALFECANRFEMCIVEFSVMTNHLHFVCEIADEQSLSRGIQGLCIRVARALNGFWNRCGKVFADRYHAHVLKTPLEVRRALAYVLRNAAHHGIHFAGPDPCSSGIWFSGWADFTTRTRDTLASPLPAARTWLMTLGWRRHGSIALHG